MLDHFDTITYGFTPRMLKAFAEKELNYGYKYGGRDDYYNNGYYPKGLSYFDYAIGPSYVLSKADVKMFNPEFTGQYDYGFFVSNRIVAHHIALEGFLSPNLSYRTKFTYTMNYGSYSGANKGKTSWASKEEPEYYDSYYFKDGLNEFYTFLEFKYAPFKRSSSSFISSVAYDFGEMYHNFGILLGFHYDGFIPVGKKK
jgi:hypothetical protein